MEELPPPLRGQTVVHLRFAYAGDDHAEAERLLVADEGRRHDPARLRRPDADRRDGRHPHGPEGPDAGLGEGHAARASCTDEAVDALLAAAGPQLDIPLIMVEIRLHGRGAGPPGEGAERRRPAASGAFSVLVLGPAVPELARVVPADRQGRARPRSRRGRRDESMINFLGDVSGPEEVAAAYPPASRQRLRAVKRAVDPAGVFSFGYADLTIR